MVKSVQPEHPADLMHITLGCHRAATGPRADGGFPPRTQQYVAVQGSLKGVQRLLTARQGVEWAHVSHNCVFLGSRQVSY
jgi:hypothetical protein